MWSCCVQVEPCDVQVEPCDVSVTDLEELPRLELVVGEMNDCYENGGVDCWDPLLMAKDFGMPCG